MARSGALALLFVAFLVGGCSLVGSADKALPAKTLSHGRFVHLMGRATRHMVCGGIPRVKPTTFAQARRNLHKIVKAFDRWLVHLRSLAPAPADAIVLNQLLGAADKLDLALSRLVDAVDARDRPRIKAIGRQIQRLTARYDRRFHAHHANGRHFHCAEQRAPTRPPAAPPRRPPAAPPAKTCRSKDHLRVQLPDGTVACIKRPVLPAG